MPPLFHALKDSFFGYARWLFAQILTLSPRSYFWLLILVSLAVALLEALRPWRRAQRFLRRDFFLDLWYVFFNFFGFGLLGYAAVSDVVAAQATALLGRLGIGPSGLWAAVTLPRSAQLLLYLIVRDFLEYFIHRLLHRVPLLWRFHQVHHSVREMGFAAHLRYHPAETVVYRLLEFIPMTLLGFSVGDFFLVHCFTLTVGHLNHANFRLPLGPFKYVFNSAEMHILHHAKAVPAPYGMNFGLTLSIWDWLFGTAWDPAPAVDRSNTELGFPGVERYPEGFFRQLGAPFCAAPTGNGGHR